MPRASQHGQRFWPTAFSAPATSWRLRISIMRKPATLNSEFVS
jgi:hypothetical protein